MRKPLNYQGATYSIIWQIGPLCHNNEILHENTHKIFSTYMITQTRHFPTYIITHIRCLPHKYSFACLYKYENLTCLQMLIMLPIQLEIRQNYHPKEVKSQELFNNV